MSFCQKKLKISTWNVNGYICKGVNNFFQKEFIDNLIVQDIFCLQETHCDLENSFQLTDFPNPVHLIRKKVKAWEEIRWAFSVCKEYCQTRC